MLKAELQKKFAEEQEKSMDLLNALTEALYQISKLENKIHDLEDRERVRYDESEKNRKESLRLAICLKEERDNLEDQQTELYEQRQVFYKTLCSIKATTELADDALSLPAMPRS